MSLEDKINSIPDDASLWLHVTIQRHQGEGWVSMTQYGIDIDAKSLKRLVKQYQPSRLERFKLWLNTVMK
jgi:hypothetical protein